MTVGLSITNNSNEMLINADVRHMHFLGRFQYGAPSASYAIDGGRYYTYAPDVSAPLPGPGYMHFTGLPNDGCGYHLDNKNVLHVVVPSGLTASIPFLYIFSTRQLTPSVGVGLQMFDATGALNYDSNQRPLHFSAVVKIAYNTAEFAAVMKGALPVNMGIIHPEYFLQEAFPHGSGAFMTLRTVRGFISAPAAGGIKTMFTQVSTVTIGMGQIDPQKHVFGASETMAPIIDTTYLS